MTSPPLLADTSHSGVAHDPLATAAPPESGVCPHPHSLSLWPVYDGSRENVHLVPIQVAVESVAAGVAHHINNLLTPLAGHTRLLAERLTRDDPATASVWPILEASTELASLADGLLSFCALNFVRPVALDVVAKIRELHETISRAAGTGVEVELRLGVDVGLVRVDALQFERALFHLIERARVSMHGRGHLWLAVRPPMREDLTLLPEHLRGMQFVVLEVGDDGRGLSSDDRDRLFEPFFGGRTVGPSVGLGLACVYGMVRRMGGQIAVSSAVDRGTMVRLYLPRLDGPPEALPGHAGGDTVLLVDDDVAVREYAKLVLAGGGYRVLEAGDGEEALRLATCHTGPIDLLVSDVLMPRIGGRELAVRLTAVRPGVRILLTSGCPDDDVCDRVEASAIAFLPKPYTPEDLTRAARHALSQRGTSGVPANY